MIEFYDENAFRKETWAPELDRKLDASSSNSPQWTALPEHYAQTGH